MVQLTRNGLKCLKIIHLFTVCCWVGGAVSLTLLNLKNTAATQEGMLYGITMSSHLIDEWVVVNMGAISCFVTGLLYALLTPWGFFKHKWIVVKWVLTILCIASGTFFLGVYEQDMLELSRTLGNSALASPEYAAIRGKHVYLSLVQAALLLFMIGISVIKPWGKKPARA